MVSWRKEDPVRSYLVILLLLCGLAAAPAAAHPPYGLVADEGGNLYFSDLETVWRLSKDGRLSVFRPHVPETHVHALALAPDGAIDGDQNHYDPATERFFSGLWRRTANGIERAIVSMTERPPPGMGVWQDSSGNRYNSQWLSTADRRVVLLRRRANGRVEVLFDESGGAARPSQPSVESVGGMAFGIDGSLFFTNGGVLRRLAPNGIVTKMYDGGSGSSLRGIAAAPDGRLLAADMGARAVLAFGADGTVSTLYRETAPWSPTAVALSGARLLVLEANADPYEREDRVRIIEVNDGRGKVIASPAHPQVADAAAPPSERQMGGRSTAIVLLASLVASVAFVAALRSRSLRDRNA
jgi:hypothetical protein